MYAPVGHCVRVAFEVVAGAPSCVSLVVTVWETRTSLNANLPRFEYRRVSIQKNLGDSVKLAWNPGMRPRDAFQALEVEELEKLFQ